jgi:hypothetical protein
VIVLVIFLIAMLALTLAAGAVAEYRRQATEQRLVEANVRVAAFDASGYEHLIGRRVVVHFENRSLRGVYARAWRDGHTLEHPEWLQGAQPAELGGSMFVPREQVSMIQAFDAADEN